MADAADITAKLDDLAAAVAALPGESGPLDLARDRVEQIRHFVAAHLAIVQGQSMAAALDDVSAADEAAAASTQEG